MFLTDAEIKARLDEFAFASEDPQQPFNVDGQVGPCSIDLRLSSQFWRLRPRWRRGRRPIRIGRVSLEEVKPRRQWQRVQLRDTQVVRLRPREMVIARTAEEFRIPPDCAALIQGRSSYARLGLSVHPSAGFINPGWSGQFPLPLMNESDATLEIPRLVAICQLMVIPLATEPEEDYAARASKYQQDDGGPSYWWRDKVLTELVGNLPGNIGDNLVRDLGEALSKFPEDLVHALDEYLDLDRGHAWSDAEALLDDFATVERNKKWRSWSAEALLAGVGTSLAASSPFVGLPQPGVFSLLGGVALVLAAGYHHAVRREFFDERRLRQLRLDE